MWILDAPSLRQVEERDDEEASEVGMTRERGDVVGSEE